MLTHESAGGESSRGGRYETQSFHSSTSIYYASRQHETLAEHPQTMYIYINTSELEPKKNIHPTKHASLFHLDDTQLSHTCSDRTTLLH